MNGVNRLACGIVLSVALGAASAWAGSSSPYANEPAPNGRRVNLGAYGNTPWASMSMSYGSVYYLR